MVSRRAIALVATIAVACGSDDAESSAPSTDGGGAQGGDASKPDASGGAGNGDATASGGAAGTGAAAGAEAGSAKCGDGTCQSGELCSNCASDCGACAGCIGASDASTALDAEESAMLVAINQYRASNGVGALTACTSLSRAAAGHAEDMRDNDYFQHTGVNGESPWDMACAACFEAGCGPQTEMASGIAAGNESGTATLAQLQAIPGDNANLLNAAFVVIGIGRAVGGGTYGIYWTLQYAATSEPSCN
jgi:hypothetical protein